MLGLGLVLGLVLGFVYNSFLLHHIQCVYKPGQEPSPLETCCPPPPGHVAPHPLPWVFFAPPPMAENPGYAFDHIKGLLTNRFVLQSVLFLVTGGGGGGSRGFKY